MLDPAFLASVAHRAAVALAPTLPGLRFERVGEGFNVQDPSEGITVAVGVRVPEKGDAVLSVWAIPPDVRPMDAVAGQLIDCPVPLASAAARPDATAAWVAHAVAHSRAAALAGITTAKMRLQQEQLERERREAREQAVQRQQAAREAAELAAAAEAARLAAEAEARECAERLRAEQAARASRKAAVLARLGAALATDFLGAEDVLRDDPDRGPLEPDDIDGLRQALVAGWAQRHAVELDIEQSAAVGTVGAHLKVTARAGSGKTRTLTARAIFLQTHCGIPPNQMLLLAFNRDAATVMRDRIARAVGEATPHVMTFHALAHALVHPDEDLLYDDESQGALALSRAIQTIIDEHMRSEDHRPRIRQLMLSHFRDDWERIERGGFELPIPELLAHRRSLPREALGGQYVKSYGEKLIANTLFEHAIEYKYERNFRWDGVNYRPDFTIPTGPRSGVAIEYFGRAGDADYDARSEEKRAFWRSRDGWTLLEYAREQVAGEGREAFAARLLTDLRRLGITGRHLSEPEIWERVKDRAIDRFTKAMTGFVGRARRLDLDSEALAGRVEAHEPISVAEGLFLGVGQSVYAGYLQRLAAEPADDFDGLMWRAVRTVRDGETRFVRDRGRETGDLCDLRFVLVDEFQDFTPVFYELLDAIRQPNPSVEFMCVGDDWQAINGWAGADLAYFDRFTDWFQGGRELAITTNYRSAESIVAAGNVVMRSRGKPARPREGAGLGAVRIGWLDQFQPSSVELDRHEGDELTPAVLRVVSPLLAAGRSVVLLSRRNHVGGYVRYRDAARRSVDGPERFLAHVRSYLPVDERDHLTISTAHRYKGRESDAVVVLDAIDGAYPLVHPNWSFLRLFGDRVDSIVEADRRLFYVTVTRAQNDLFMLSESNRSSPFLDDLRRGAQCEILSWDQLVPAPSLEGERVEVRVSGYHVRDQLSALQFQYSPRLKVWSQLLPRDGFRMEVLVSQPWSGGCDSITVCDESGAVLETWAPSSAAGGST